jgi:hypothetical protein
MRTEAKILEELSNAQAEEKSARISLELHRKAFIEAETNLINSKLLITKLNEELRIINARKVSTELSDRDIEVEGFRSRMPDLIKKGYL